MKMAKKTREKDVVEEVLKNFMGMYDCLEDFTLRNRIRELVKVPNFDTYQLKYDNVKAQVERICELQSKPV